MNKTQIAAATAMSTPHPVERIYLTPMNAIRSVTEASSIGLRPGFWPTHLAVPFSDTTLYYTRERFERDSENDITAAYYVHGEHKIIVLND